MLYAPLLHLAGVQYFRFEVSLNVNGPRVGQAIAMRNHANALQFPSTQKLAF
jgi:hypothetical protein